MNEKISKESIDLPSEILMYDCNKIKRLTVLYKSKGPGTYAGDQRKILTGDEVLSICQEANRRGISIEMLIKEREPVEAVVINTVIPFEHHVSTEIQDSAKKAREEESAKEKAAAPPNTGEQNVPEKSNPEPENKPDQAKQNETTSEETKTTNQNDKEPAKNAPSEMKMENSGESKPENFK